MNYLTSLLKDNPVFLEVFDSIRLWHVGVGLVALVAVGFMVFGSGLSEHSTCRQFNTASASAQNKILASMTRAHGGGADVAGAGFSSLSMYCYLYPSRPINGIYSGN